MTSTQKLFISLLLLVFAAGMALASFLYTSSRTIAHNVNSLNETNSDVKKNETESSATSLDVFPETTNAPTPVSILAVGDIMLGRYVQTLMEKKGEDYPFEKIGDLFDGHDVVLANLEGPIQNGPKTPDDSLVFRFPESVAPLLARRGITHVSLANNHTLNQGKAGLDNTRSILAQNHVSFFGDPVQDGQQVLAEEIEGMPITWIGANAAVRSLDADVITREIRKHSDGNVVVFVHWGNEYVHTPSSLQRELAHEWVDAGADVVIGHHPHVIQTVELYNDHMIFYSLGNFIFDQYFSQDTQEMLAVNLLLEEETVTAKLIPLTSSHSQPQIAESARRTEVLNKLANWSDPSIRPAIINGEFILKREEL